MQKLKKALKKLAGLKPTAASAAKKASVAAKPTAKVKKPAIAAKKAPATKKKTQSVVAKKPAPAKKAPAKVAAKPAAKAAAKKPAPAAKPAPKSAAKVAAPKGKAPASAKPTHVVAPAKEAAAKKAAPAAAAKAAKAAPAAPVEKAPVAPKSAKAKKRDEAAVAEVAAEDEEVVLTDADGRRYCRVKECDQLASVDSYCRYHYLLFWRNIQNRKKILTEGKLERYVEELTARYPDKYLEMLRKDLRSEKDFTAAIQELEIDESASDAEFEDESQGYLDEVRGMGSEPASGDQDDF